MSDLREPMSQSAEQVRDVFPEQHQWEASYVDVCSRAKDQHEIGGYRVLRQCVTKGRTLYTNGLTHQSTQAIPPHSIEPPARNCISDTQGSFVSALDKIQTR